jgi:hypothetical protein
MRKNGEGFLQSKNPPTLCPTDLIGDMVRHTWPPACWCSRCRPTSCSCNMTFISLHAFVSLWYLCKLAMTLSFSSSSKSFSSVSLRHARASIPIHRLRCFTSSSSTASAPYINRNGVKFVALQTIILWLHTALGMASVNFPFFSLFSIFLIDSNIKALVLSTAPLD